MARSSVQIIWDQNQSSYHNLSFVIHVRCRIKTGNDKL